MRKIGFLPCILICCFCLEANTEPATANLTFTPEGIVYAGFSTQEIVDLMPISVATYSEGEEIYFEYDDASNSFLTPFFYYYVQAFVSDRIKITLSAGDCLEFTQTGSTGSWWNQQNIYAASFRLKNIYNDYIPCSLISPDITLTNLNSQELVLVDESRESINTNVGRPYHGSLRFQVDLEEVESNAEASYGMTLTLTVEAVQ